MTQMQTNYPNRITGTAIPELTFELLSGGQWNSQAKMHYAFTLLTIYRGMWCGHCKHQLMELNRLHDEFSARNVNMVAVSADTLERASSTVVELNLDKLEIGINLPIEQARLLGVFVSKQVKPIEMPLFCEPASFLIREDGTVFAAWIASNAFARTEPADILAYLDFVKDNAARPPRGSA
tara:strand:+ start:4977 stop:5516 length:540 start_codon:yes stop_codon:yes gene_type:complete